MVTGGEKNEAKEKPSTVNNTRVTRFRTRTGYSRIVGNCNFTPTLLICLASAKEGGTTAILFYFSLQYGNLLVSKFLRWLCTDYGLRIKYSV